MELALLVYVLGVLPSAISFMLWITSILAVALLIIWLDYFDRKAYKPPVKTSWLCLLLAIIIVFIPSERTAYLMVGAYTAQKIAETPQVLAVSADVIKIITAKIKTYAEEVDKVALPTN